MYIEHFTQQEQNIHFLSTMEYLPSIQYLEHKKNLNLKIIETIESMFSDKNETRNQ